jgi:hypothetical protein
MIYDPLILQNQPKNSMKYLLIFIFFAGSLKVHSQIDSNAGTYGLNPPLDTGVNIKWTLSLNPDGTFLYNFYRNLNCDIYSEENFYGKETWKSEKSLIYFTTNEKDDLDETHTMNFNNTKARINRKSPRDISNKITKESIIFYSSEISTIKGLELFKTE